MKAVIVEASGSMAVALRDDGSFIKIKNEGYSIGDELTSKAKILQFPKQVVAAACSALVVLLGAGGVGAYQWNSPYSYVTLDVNPSIEYSLNKFDKVIAVNGLNEAGDEIALSLGKMIKNRDISQALEITVDTLKSENDIKDLKSIPVIGVYSDNFSKTEALLATASDFSDSIVALSKDDKDKVDSGVSLSEIASEVKPVTEEVEVKETETKTPVVKEEVVVVEPEKEETIDESMIDSSTSKTDEAPVETVIDEPADVKNDEVIESSPVKGGEETTQPADNNSTDTTISDTTDTDVVDETNDIEDTDTDASSEDNTEMDENASVNKDATGENNQVEEPEIEQSPVKK